MSDPGGAEDRTMSAPDSDFVDALEGSEGEERVVADGSLGEDHGSSSPGSVDEQTASEGEIGIGIRRGGGLYSWSADGPVELPDLTVARELLWEVAEVPLGYQDLRQFGPNGPPINVLDHCPVSDCLWVVNGHILHRLPVADVERLSRGELSGAFATLALGAQANRLRCGTIAGRPVAVVVDAAGGVNVVPTGGVEGDLRVAASLRNMAEGALARGTSSWGIALTAHDDATGRCPLSDPSHEDSHRHGGGAAGILAVSANDHCVKAWLVEPNLQPEEGAEGQRGYPGFGLRSWHVLGGGSGGKERPKVALEHEQNIPCIDFANGRLLSASLDGTLQSVDLAATCGSLATGSVTSPRLDEGEGLWGACWIPLRSIRAYPEGPGPGAASASPMSRIQWSAQEAVLPEELLLTSVWPFVGVKTLTQRVQAVSVAHARLVADEACAPHRREHLAFCFSETSAWLLDEDFRPCCKLELPFSATFAHLAYDRETSTVIMATKMCPSPSPAGSLWAISLLRRRASLRYRMQAHALRYEFPEPHWPASAFVGMSVAPGGQVFSLLASRRMACHRLVVRVSGAP